MYTYCEIEGFRVFKKLELRGLARINLIAGRNNSGKTSLLEALSLLSGRYDVLLDRMPDDAGSGKAPYSFDGGAVKLPFHTEDAYSVLAELFNELNHEQPAAITGYRDGEQEPWILKIEMSIHNVPLSDAMGRTGAAGVISKLGSVTFSYVPSGGNRLLAAFTFPPRLPLFFLSSGRNEILVKQFSQLKQQRGMGQIVEILRLFEPELRDIELLESGLYVDLPHLPQLVSLDSMGEGMRSALNMVLAISAARDGIVLIDEAENGLHYTLQADIWRAIMQAARAYNVQVFATTHSIEMIRAAYAAFRDDDPYEFSLYRLERSPQTGEIEAVTYNRDIMAAAVELDAEVRG